MQVRPPFNSAPRGLEAAVHVEHAARASCLPAPALEHVQRCNIQRYVARLLVLRPAFLRAQELHRCKGLYLDA
jgi:hypothetical protein